MRLSSLLFFVFFFWLNCFDSWLGSVSGWRSVPDLGLDCRLLGRVTVSWHNSWTPGGSMRMRSLHFWFVGGLQFSAIWTVIWTTAWQKCWIDFLKKLLTLYIYIFTCHIHQTSMSRKFKSMSYVIKFSISHWITGFISKYHWIRRAMSHIHSVTVYYV